MREIPLIEPVEVLAGLGFGLGEIIYSKAKRI
jgi:hypothetical protein